jgi:hypothetical protein
MLSVAQRTPVATGSSNNRLICNGHGPGRYGSQFRIELSYIADSRRQYFAAQKIIAVRFLPKSLGY